MWCNKVVAMRVFINILNILNIAHFHVCTKHGCCLHCSAEKVQSFMRLHETYLQVLCVPCRGGVAANNATSWGICSRAKFRHRQLVVARPSNTAMAVSRCCFPGTISCHVESQLTTLPAQLTMSSVSVRLAINVVVVLILCGKLTAGEVESLLTYAPLTATVCIVFCVTVSSMVLSSLMHVRSVSCITISTVGMVDV